jgi:hypothetical protein
VGGAVVVVVVWWCGTMVMVVWRCCLAVLSGGVVWRCCLAVLYGGAGCLAGEDFRKQYLCCHCRGRSRLLPHQKHLRRFGRLHWCGGELVNVFVSSYWRTLTNALDEGIALMACVVSSVRGEQTSSFPSLNGVDNLRLADFRQRIAVTRSATGHKITQASRLTKIETPAQITRSCQRATLLRSFRSSWWPFSDRLFASRDILSVLSGCHRFVRLSGLCSFLPSVLPLFVRLRGFCGLLIRGLHLGLPSLELLIFLLINDEFHMSHSQTPLSITPARNIKYLFASDTLLHVTLERRERTRLGVVIRGSLDRNAVTMATDDLAATGFVPLPIGLLIVLIAVRDEFATAAE